MTNAPHAFLPPSSAARWAGQRCTGSPTLETRYSDNVDAEGTAAAAEGHGAHWVAAQALRGINTTAGTFAPNGIVIDEEMIEAADLYVRYVLERYDGNVGVILHVEEFVKCAAIHESNGGTPDVWWFIPHGAGGNLFVPDFKYGHGFVDAFENWQLIDYVAGILSREEFIGMDRRQIKVEMSVIQPRNYHPSGPIRSWTVTATELHPFFTQLEEAAVEACGPNATTRVGPACDHCKGRHACEALHAAADTVADIAGGAASMELSPQALGVELRMLQRASVLLTARLTGLEAEAMAMLKAGKSVPFFAIASSQSREGWTKTPDEILTLGTLMGVDLAKPAAPITPGQARKAGLPDDVVASYATRPPGSFKLVPFNTINTKRIFSP